MADGLVRAGDAYQSTVHSQPRSHVGPLLPRGERAVENPEDGAGTEWAWTARPPDGSREPCATLLFQRAVAPPLAASALVLQSSLSPPVIPYFHYKAHTQSHPGHRTPAWTAAHPSPPRVRPTPSGKRAEAPAAPARCSTGLSGPATRHPGPRPGTLPARAPTACEGR